MAREDGRLLVVDDNEENRILLTRRLTREGFVIIGAESGEQALDIVLKEPVDLVLLDWMMPGMDGLEVLKLMRAAPALADLPVIMVTAKSDSADIVEALESGANDYITKPVDFPVALARIEAQLRVRIRNAPSSVPSSPGLLEPGAVLAGRYRLDAQIGSGSFGTVWKARHLDLEHDVALKVLRKVGGEDDSLARFRREGISACRVKHPNAVTVLDFVVTPERIAFLVMELLEGHSLREELSRDGRISPARAIDLVAPVCDVLAEAHRSGVVHRDIKPSNIFIQKTASGERTKVLDFGIAKVAGLNPEDARTGEGMIIGTLSYMAPERFHDGPFDGSLDVYSVGVTLYEAMAGRTPFPNTGDAVALARMHISEPPPPLRESLPDVAPELEALILQALAKVPGERPAIDTLGAALRQVRGAAGSMPEARRSGPGASATDTTTVRMSDEDAD